MGLFHLHLKIQTRVELRRQGFGFWRVQELMSGFTGDLPGIAAEQAGVAIPPEVLAADAADGVHAIGDGTILKAILDFLKSDAGQAILKALIALLIGAT